MVSYDPLYFCGIPCKGLSVLSTFSKNHLLVSLIFSVVILVSISFISTLIFVISFILLTLDFFFLLLVPWSVIFCCLFASLLFLQVGLCYYELPPLRITLLNLIILVYFNIHLSQGIFCICVLVAQLCLTLCIPMACSPPCSSVHGILQARVLELVAISFSRGIFPTQGLNPGLLHCRQILYHLNHQGFFCWPISCSVTCCLISR